MADDSNDNDRNDFRNPSFSLQHNVTAATISSSNKSRSPDAHISAASSQTREQNRLSKRDSASSHSPRRNQRQSSSSSSMNKNHAASNADNHISNGNDKDVDRKLDYLLKKTRKLEDTISSLREDNKGLWVENKKTQECTVNLWESIKNDRESVSVIREDMATLRAKLDLINQKSLALEGSVAKACTCVSVDVGAVSEHVFSRVHREFSTVVDEIVRACVKEQVDFLSKWTAKSGSVERVGDSFLLSQTQEDSKSMKLQLASLKRRHEDLESSVRDSAGAQQSALREAISTTRSETQLLLESFSRRMNDSIEFAISNVKEEVKEKYDAAVRQLITSCNDLQVRIAESEEQMSQVEELISGVRQSHDLKTSNLSTVIEGTSNSLGQLSESFEEMKLDIAAEKQQRESKLEEVSSLSSSRFVAIEGKSRHLEESMNTYLQLLEEHRSDYTETISKLSSACRGTKSNYQELLQQVQALGSVKSSVDEVLAKVIQRCEDDRSVISKVLKDNNKLFSIMSEIKKDSEKPSKKSKSGNKSKSGGGALDEEVAALRERVDIFEESVIDTVQQIILNRESDAMRPLEMRLQTVESFHEKYESLVKSSVEKCFDSDVIPIVSSVSKLESLVNNMVLKLAMQSLAVDLTVDPGKTEPPAQRHEGASDVKIHLTTNYSDDIRDQDVKVPTANNNGNSSKYSSESKYSFSDSKYSFSDSFLLHSDNNINGAFHSHTFRDKKHTPLPSTEIMTSTPTQNSQVTSRGLQHDPLKAANSISASLCRQDKVLASSSNSASALPDLRKKGPLKDKIDLQVNEFLKPHQHMHELQSEGRRGGDVSASDVKKSPTATATAQSKIETDLIFKNLEEKKQRHRKSFQLMVKGD